MKFRRPLLVATVVALLMTPASFGAAKLGAPGDDPPTPREEPLLPSSPFGCALYESGDMLFVDRAHWISGLRLRIVWTCRDHRAVAYTLTVYWDVDGNGELSDEDTISVFQQG